ncbi:hypothetical protein BH11PLA1_BH11PLA1_16080 [soil metagenome]
MRIARPSILWRFIQRELWRLLLITAAILSLVIAFAFAIKPIADGRVAGLDALRLMGYALVPMLQYSLPFAAGFAATLSYHRMAQDNELTAVYAGGISHRALLLPALISGLILGAVVMVLADQAMPRLMRSAQELVTNEVTRMIAKSVERGESFVVPNKNTALFAEKFVERDADTERTGAFKRFDLLGLVVIEPSAEGGLKWGFSARQASVAAYRGEIGGGLGASRVTPVGSDDQTADSENTTTLVMRLLDSVGGKQGAPPPPPAGQKDSVQAKSPRTTGEDERRPWMAEGWAGESTFTVYLPTQFREDPKFLSFAEMQAASKDPRGLGSIESHHQRVAGLLGERAAADELRDRLRREGRAAMSDLSGRTVVLKADNLAATPDGDGFALSARGGGTIELVTVLDGGRMRVQRAKHAWVSVPPAKRGLGAVGSSLLTVRLNEVATSGAGEQDSRGEPRDSRGGGGDAPGYIKDYSVPNLVLADDPLPALLRLGSDDLLAKAELRVAAGPADEILSKATTKYEEELRDIRREIMSKEHERVAASLVCCVMVVLGAVMGMRLGGGVPLAVYLWSFLPALAAVLLISGGQRATASWGAGGLMVLYGGVAMLLVVLAAQYRMLRTH